MLVQETWLSVHLFLPALAHAMDRPLTVWPLAAGSPPSLSDPFGSAGIPLFSGTGSPRRAFSIFALVNRMCTGCPQTLPVIPRSSCSCPWSHICNTGHSEDPIAQDFRQEMITVPDFAEVGRIFGSPQYYRKRCWRGLRRGAACCSVHS